MVHNSKTNCNEHFQNARLFFIVVCQVCQCHKLQTATIKRRALCTTNKLTGDSKDSTHEQDKNVAGGEEQFRDFEFILKS